MSNGDSDYEEKLREEASFWDQRARRLWASGRVPLWFDHRRGQDVSSIPLAELKGAGIRANPALYRIVYGEIIERIIRVATARRGTALDLGCGAGWLSLELARRGMSVDGLDIGPAQIEIARKMSEESRESSDPRLHGDFGRTRYRVADLNTIRLAEAKYDVVVSMGTLHHVGNVDRLIREVAKSLKPGGLFVFWEYIGYSGPARLFPAAFRVLGIPVTALRRLVKKRAARPSTSPFESISQSEIVELTRRRLSIRSLESRFLFLPVVVTRMRIYRLPRALGVPLVAFLKAADQGLIRSRLFRGPYVLAFARKTDGRKAGPEG
jgi:SAM-dependent methyltransferase